MTPAPTASESEKRARFRARVEESILPPLVALAIAAVVGDILILIFGQAPGEVYVALAGPGVGADGSRVASLLLDGGRDDVRREAVRQALALAAEELADAGKQAG